MVKKVQKVRKRDGREVDFDPEKISSAIFKATVCAHKPDSQLAKEMTGKVVQAVFHARKQDEIPTVEQIQDIVEKILMDSGHSDVAKSYILYRGERTALREKKELLGVKDDLKLSLNATKVLKKRFLRRDEQGNVLETPGEMFKRVAKDISLADKKYDQDPNISEKVFYEVMASLEFLPNSPTLRNAGRELQQLSGCYVLPIKDSLNQIYKTLRTTAFLHKGGSGTGTNFSCIRPKGDLIKSTGGIASGPVSFMKLFDFSTEIINEGSTRRGGVMGILNVDHPDIFEFISAKLDFNQLNNFNISVGITDKFMQELKKNEMFELVNPHNNKVVDKIEADELFSRIIESAWKSGEPGIIFLDAVNRHNTLPGIGKLEATNLCGEVPLFGYESCILGGINLAKMLKHDDEWLIDWDKIKRITRIGVHFLDNLIDRNHYVMDEMKEISMANRKIGLGVMGFADMLIKLKIPYDSDEAVQIAEKIIKFIKDEGLKASVDLAKIRGVFSNYDKSSFKEEGIKPRNATITTIAPTGNRSIIADCSSGIEPLFALCYVRKNLLDLGEDELFEVNREFELELKNKGIYYEDLMREVAAKGGIQDIELPSYIKKVFVTALDIAPEWHVKIQAAFQKYTDNAVSKTVNFPNSATRDDVKKAFVLAYETGCKSTTIYRYGSRDKQVLNLAKKKEK